MGLSNQAQQPELKSPSIGEITTNAVNANIANLPAIIEAYQKYGPQAAASMLDAARALNPTLQPLADLLSSRISMASSGGIPDTLRKAYETSFRNASAARGFADSPASANAEAIGLAGLGEEFAQNTIEGANNFGRMLPDTPGLGDLGLNLPSVESQESGALDAAKIANDVELSNWKIKQSNKKRTSSQLGGLIGGGVGFAAGGPAGAATGYRAGTTIGGTFF